MRAWTAVPPGGNLLPASHPLSQFEVPLTVCECRRMSLETPVSVYVMHAQRTKKAPPKLLCGINWRAR